MTRLALRPCEGCDGKCRRRVRVDGVWVEESCPHCNGEGAERALVAERESERG